MSQSNSIQHRLARGRLVSDDADEGYCAAETTLPAPLPGTAATRLVRNRRARERQPPSTRMSLLVAPARVHGARAIASRSAPRLNPLRAATLPPRPARSARRVAASASLSSTAPALFELAGNANQLVDGCGVNGTCGQVAAPPFALISEAPSPSAQRCSLGHLRPQGRRRGAGGDARARQGFLRKEVGVTSAPSARERRLIRAAVFTPHRVLCTSATAVVRRGR